MSCGIYAIVNKLNGKRYVGKSSNIESRWSSHLSQLRREVRAKDTNRHLYGAFKKCGEECFGFEYLEVFDLDEAFLSQRELFWIEKLDTLNREFGYNLRKDTSSKCIVSEETRKIISELNTGDKNPNFGISWTDEQKEKASSVAKLNHSLGRYSSEETKKKHSDFTTKFWSENPEIKDVMRRKVSASRTQYKISQYTMSGELVKTWDTMLDILTENPDYHRISIYSCVNGHKKSYRGFIWRKS